MMKNELNKEYFEWICQLVCDEEHSKTSHLRLLRYLYEVDFFAIIKMDENRAEDGVDLRQRFGYENHYEYSIIEEFLDKRNCSILEMIAALSMRCEENIMDNPDIGNRMSQWFWDMISNLGLRMMDDLRFDRFYVDDVISRFLNRKYKRNGEGGLFTVKQCPKDLRRTEIWYQMCLYLDSIL